MGAENVWVESLAAWVGDGIRRVRVARWRGAFWEGLRLEGGPVVGLVDLATGLVLKYGVSWVRGDVLR